MLSDALHHLQVARDSRLGMAAALAALMARRMVAKVLERNMVV